MTGFEKYVGIKRFQSLFIWTEKTFFIYLGAGTELLHVTVSDYILDMSECYNYLYVLTKSKLLKF